ncbi:calcium-dependent protein kinase 24-like [Hibiscus syriacus]|uniref:calcium-dependent protein kinase 24-like n=1 Tax=Hibiscus syriacus TaxID=106335 RepID=UPI001922031D|nr:calcium-dependent protein kinase 24-like [Hibiscus syriacus]
MDNGCIMCGNDLEIRDHLFANCSFAKEVWDAILVSCEICSGLYSWGDRMDWLVENLRDNEEGIAHAIIRGKIDFERDPWPKVSEETKDLVKRMLDHDPRTRITVQQVYEHPWIQNLEHARNVNLGERVRARIKQFSLMNKFKKEVLRVVADNLQNERVDSIKEMFNMMDTDESGNLTFEELEMDLRKSGILSMILMFRC